MTAQESKLQEFTAGLQSESGRKNCFRIARQMDREGRYVISVCCMKNDAGNVVSDGMKNIWRKYMAPNDTFYKRWSGHKLLCKLCRTFQPPAMGKSTPKHIHQHYAPL